MSPPSCVFYTNTLCIQPRFILFWFEFLILVQKFINFLKFDVLKNGYRVLAFGRGLMFCTFTVPSQSLLGRKSTIWLVGSNHDVHHVSNMSHNSLWFHNRLICQTSVSSSPAAPLERMRHTTQMIDVLLTGCVLPADHLINCSRGACVLAHARTHARRQTQRRCGNVWFTAVIRVHLHRCKRISWQPPLS